MGFRLNIFCWEKLILWWVIIFLHCVFMIYDVFIYCWCKSVTVSHYFYQRVPFLRSKVSFFNSKLVVPSSEWFCQAISALWNNNFNSSICSYMLWMSQWWLCLKEWLHLKEKWEKNMKIELRRKWKFKSANVKSWRKKNSPILMFQYTKMFAKEF